MTKAVIPLTGVTGVTKTSTTLFDKALGVVTLPLAAFKSDETAFISEKDAGVAVISGMAAGFALGDKFGAKVPFLGGRR